MTTMPSPATLMDMIPTQAIQKMLPTTGVFDTLTFITLWANSADEKLMISF